MPCADRRTRGFIHAHRAGHSEPNPLVSATAARAVLPSTPGTATPGHQARRRIHRARLVATKDGPDRRHEPDITNTPTGRPSGVADSPGPAIVEASPSGLRSPPTHTGGDQDIESRSALRRAPPAVNGRLSDPDLRAGIKLANVASARHRPQDRHYPKPSTDLPQGHRLSSSSDSRRARQGGGIAAGLPCSSRVRQRNQWLTAGQRRLVSWSTPTT